MRGKRFLLVGLAIVGASDRAVGRDEPTSPRTPADERVSFQLSDPGLVVELVAAEPDVSSPVAVAWDERGRMFVAEMIDYPAGPPGGRVRLLEGPRGDGTFERAIVFAEGLPFPNGVLPARGGVLVTAAPDVWFLKDEDGDGVAETRRVVLTGFAEGNQQLRVNGLFLGLDGWIYGANGRSSGVLHRPGDPAGGGISIQGHDFRFRFDGRAVTDLEAIAGFSQFGLARDDWGNRFPSWNTTPWRHVVLEDDVIGRDPGLLGARGVSEVIPTGDVTLFPISRAPTTFNRESVRSFNASCGPVVLRGEGIGAGYLGDALVCEPLLNLVHHRDLEPSGPTFIATRAESGREFLASSDSWFHPVWLGEGPDGSLVVCDFYRRWVEHPDFVPADRRDAVDWREGSERGRIWRIRRQGADRQSVPPLDDQEDLIAALGSERAWVRDTARRLLIERHTDDPEAERLLVGDMRADGPTLARAQALWTLSGIAKGVVSEGALTEEIGELLDDPDARMRQQALRVLAARGETLTAGDRVAGLADDPDERVRLALAIVLRKTTGPTSVAARARLLDRDADEEFARTAILSGAAASAGSLLDALVERDSAWLERPTEGRARVLTELGRMIAGGSDEVARERLAERLLAVERAGGSGARVALLAGWTRTGVELPAGVDRLWRQTEDLSLDERAETHLRALAVATLGRGRPDAARAAMRDWLDSATPEVVQAAAVDALILLDDAELTAQVLEEWGRLTLATRAWLLVALARSTGQATALLDAIEEGSIGAHELDPAQRAALGQARDPGVRDRVESLLGQVEGDRAAIVERYRATVVGSAGDATAGQELFVKHCASCHRMGAQGTAVGPDLTSVAGRPTEALIDDVMDPSREVSPDFRNFVVFTTDGRVATGLLAADRPGGLVLRSASGVEVIVSRGDVEELKLTEKSLMPEGFEQQLTPGDLAHLIAFLRRGGAPSAP